jgi:uncharacterized protein
VSVAINNPGGGYAPPPAAAPAVNFVNAVGDATGQGAAASATVNPAGQISAVTVANNGGGSGYTAPPQVQIGAPPAGGTQATAVVPQVLYTGIVGSIGGKSATLVRGKMTPEDDVVVR